MSAKGQHLSPLVFLTLLVTATLFGANHVAAVMGLGSYKPPTPK